MTTQHKKGKFIVFEGIDCSGKSTQISTFEQKIRGKDKYKNVLLTREPTDRAGEIRSKLESNENPFTDGKQMARLYIEDRKQHYFRQIRPSLEYGTDVLCDRFSLSTIAYQSTQGEGYRELLNAHVEAQIPSPNLTFYLRINVEEFARRMDVKEKTENL